MNLKGNKNELPRKRRSLGNSEETNEVTEAPVMEEDKGTAKKGLFGSKKEKSARKERPTRSARPKREQEATVDDTVEESTAPEESSTQEEKKTKRSRKERPARSERAKKERPTRPERQKKERPVRGRRGKDIEALHDVPAAEDVVNDVLASNLDLPNLDLEVQEEPQQSNDFEFDNNLAEHQIRHRRVKEVAPITTEDDFIASIGSTGMELGFLQDMNTSMDLDNLVTTEDVDTSMFEESEEDVFIKSLIEGTADTSAVQEAAKVEEPDVTIEVTKQVGSINEFAELEPLPEPESPEEPPLETSSEPSVEPSTEPLPETESEQLSETDPLEECEPESTPLPEQETQTVFTMLTNLHNEYPTRASSKCLSEEELKLELYDDHLGRIEKAGVYDFTLPIYKVYYKGHAIKMNRSFEYKIPRGAEVEIDFGLRVSIPEGHILSVSSIGELEDKMHVQFSGKHYFNSNEAFAGVRMKVKSLSPLSYLPVKLPVFKGTIIRNETVN